MLDRVSGVSGKPDPESGLTCSSFVFDLLQFGERGRGQDFQINTFPRLKEIHQTIHGELEDKHSLYYLFLEVNPDPGQDPEQTDKNDLVWAQIIVHLYRVIDYLDGLRLDREQLVSGVALRVQFEHNTEQRRRRVSH